MNRVTATVFLGALLVGEPLVCEPRCVKSFVYQDMDRGLVLMSESQSIPESFTPYGGFQPFVRAWMEKSWFGRPKVAGSLQLSFGRVGPLQFDKCQTPLALADGERVPLGVATYHEGYMGSDSTYDHYVMSLDEKAIAQLGRATEVELKICRSTTVEHWISERGDLKVMPCDAEVKASEQFVCALHELACKAEELRSGRQDFKRCEPQPPPGPPAAPARHDTTLVGTGSSELVDGGSQQMSAQLRDATSGLPLAGRTVTFTVGSISAAAVTDASGNAVATLVIPIPYSKYCHARIEIAFGGDATAGPASTTVWREVRGCAPRR